MLSTQARADFDTVIDVPPNLGDSVDLDDNTQLNVGPGGSVGVLLSAAGEPGELGSESVGAINVEVNVTGGTIGQGANFDGDVTINLSSGSFSSSFMAGNGATVNMSGGNIGPTSGIAGYGNATVMHMTGGTLGDAFDVSPGSTLNMSGGTFGQQLEVFGDTSEFDPFNDTDAPGHLNFIGTSFAVGGTELTLTPNTPYLVTDRGDDLLLSGTLADGTPFNFNLNSSFVAGEDVLYTNAMLTVTLVPEPTSAALLAVLMMAPLASRRPRHC